MHPCIEKVALRQNGGIVPPFISWRGVRRPDRGADGGVAPERCNGQLIDIGEGGAEAAGGSVVLVPTDTEAEATAPRLNDRARRGAVPIIPTRTGLNRVTMRCRHRSGFRLRRI
jgi:hypothetical protein